MRGRTKEENKRIFPKKKEMLSTRSSGGGNNGGGVGGGFGREVIAGGSGNGYGMMGGIGAGMSVGMNAGVGVNVGAGSGSLLRPSYPSSSQSSTASMDLLPVGNFATMLPPWIKRYPCIANAVLPVSQLFQAAQQIHEREHDWGNSHVEVELRFGRCMQNELRPGVSKAFLQQAYAAACEHKTWHAVNDWELATDVHYYLPPKADSFNPKGTPVRTTVQFLSERQQRRRGLDFPQIVTHVTKNMIRRYDFQFTPFPGFADHYKPALTAAAVEAAAAAAVSSTCTGPNEMAHVMNSATAAAAAAASQVPTHADIRIAVSSEHTLSKDQLPENAGKPTFVRIKNRRRFLYRPDGCTKPHVAYDFTLSWYGKSYAEAERKMEQEQTAYELEIELLHVNELMRMPGRDAINLAASMLLKAADFLGPPDSFSWFPAASFMTSASAASSSSSSSSAHHHHHPHSHSHHHQQQPTNALSAFSSITIPRTSMLM